MKQLPIFGAMALSLLLGACIDPQVAYRATGSGAKVERVPASGDYTVQRGDTLYGIAFAHQLDMRDIASWNRLSEPYIIQVGQRLRLQSTVAAATVAAPNAAQNTAQNSVQNQNNANANAAIPSSVAATVPTLSTATSTDAPPALSMSAPTPVVGASSTNSAPTVSANAGSHIEQLPPSSVPVLGSKPPSAGAVAPSSHVDATAANVPSAAVAAPVLAAPTMPTPGMPTPGISTPAIKAPSTALPSVVSTPVKSGWVRPATGKVISTFAAAIATRQGIDIAGVSGDAILAANAGEVVYSGRGIVGYGELIVIKHDDATLSAYGHNRKRLVKEGDSVTSGQQIAEMGKDLRGRELLHFEVRRNGKPIDPAGVIGR
jgi:lipoprotein NlpD